MSSTANRRRIPSVRLLALLVVAVAAVVIVVVLIGGDSGLKKSDTIQVGAAPAGVALGAGSVWVVNNEGGSSSG